MSRLGLFIVVVAVGLLAAACGGSSDDGDASDTGASVATTAASAVTDTTETPGSTDAPQSDEQTSEAGESAATVTIDGVAYEFGANGPAATCEPDFFGGFFAVLVSTDLTANFSVELWNEGAGDGEQVSNATMLVEADGEILDLAANPESSWPAAEAGSSYIDTFTYEGNRANGTIYFINTEVAYNADLAPLDPIVGEFEIVCADG